MSEKPENKTVFYNDNQDKSDLSDALSRVQKGYMMMHDGGKAYAVLYSERHEPDLNAILDAARIHDLHQSAIEKAVDALAFASSKSSGYYSSEVRIKTNEAITALRAIAGK